jgi:hypothetical protein
MAEALEERQLLSIALPASPKIVTTASPAAITLAGSPITLTDTAVVTNGFNPTGNLRFTLRGPDNFLFTQLAPLTGDGTYTAHDTLPANALPGTYRWTVTYAGDSNNNSAADQESNLAAFDASLPKTATETLTFPGSGNPPTSYFSAKLSAASILNGIFKDWCADPVRHITPGIPYTVDVYSSAGATIPQGVLNIPQNLPLVNYLLNQNLVGKTAPDGHQITFGDVQEAIWILLASGPGTSPPGVTFIKSHVDQMISDAQNHKDFVPGVGQLIAVILRPVNSADQTDAQVNIAVLQVQTPVRGTAEQTIVRKPATLAIHTTQLPTSAVIGSSISDKAIITGGTSPTGTVTFKLYNNPTGTGTPLFIDTESLVGGIATSASFVTTGVGTDYWVATYNGDSHNASITSGKADEPVTIRKAAPHINTTQLPAGAIVGSSIADRATVTGGLNPTGTVTFRLYSNPSGTGTPLFVDTETLAGGIATSASFVATSIGTDYWVATYNGDSKNSSISSGKADEPVTIRTAGPSINTTQLPASAIVGSAIADKATVIGGNNPTGTVTFKLYSNPTGTGTPLFTDTETLVGGIATSASFIATAVGTDYWVATYNGDSHNASATSGKADEPVIIRKARPHVNTTQLPASAEVGSSIADKAAVSGGFNPTGTVTFQLFNNPTGTGTPLFTDTESLVGGIATSASFVAATAGTDYWVATYNGDSNNSSVISGKADEPVTIRTAGPSINTTQLPTSAIVGSLIADKATVVGGNNPTGTVTFKLYNNPNGTGTPLITDTEPLTGGVAISTGYTATAVGTDYWVATYNGDSNNASVTSGTADEPVTIRKAGPAIYTVAGAPVVICGVAKLTDTAVLSGGFNDTGTITFTLRNSSNTAVYTDVVTVNGNGTYTTANGNNPGGYLPTAVGTYQWTAVYSGDANNDSAHDQGGPLETQTVGPAGPAIKTTPVVTTTTTGSAGSFATIGFWHNKNGQALINSFDSGPSSKLLGNSLATHYPHLFGATNSYTGTSLAGLTNAQVAAAYLNTWTPGGLQKNTYVQAFAVALGSYGSGGLGSFSVGNNGAAFGVANGTTLPITQILSIADAAFNPATGQFFGGDSTKTGALNTVLNNINMAGEQPGGIPIVSVATTNDTATLSGGFAETGTITFYLMAPGSTAATPLSSAVYTDIVTVNGNGTYSTATMGNHPGGYVPPSTGTYQLIAVYSGDTNNSGVISPFGSEPITVGK